MTAPLIACFEPQDDTQAVRVMQERQLRHPAVLSRGQRLVGIISRRDGAAPGREWPRAGGAIRWPA